MSYVSIPFLLFVAAVLLVYYLCPQRWQWVVLLAASLGFYVYSGPSGLLFLALTAATVYAGGLALQRNHDGQKALLAQHDAQWQKANRREVNAQWQKKRRCIVAVVLVLNFGILALLKYSGFILSNFGITLAAEGSEGAFTLLLPLGISFYTFQAAGYLIDVYRGKTPACRNPLQLLLFLSFFPQIVQGPIGRWSALAPQLLAGRRFEYNNLKFGAQLIAWGFFKKLLIGDLAARHVMPVLADYTRFSGAETAVTMVMFMAYIYGDFSGGIDVTRGVAQCLGIEMAENFRRPHFAMSVSEYWRRWHITLGAWMKDYLLYPLSLSRAFGKLGKAARKVLGGYLGKLFPTCLAMLIVFLTVGVWHGASWKYVAFGLYNGACIIGGVLLADPQKKFFAKHPGIGPHVPFWRVLATLKTLFLVFISKYFAAATSFTQAAGMLRSTFSPSGAGFAALPALFQWSGFSALDMAVLVVSCTVLFCVSLLQERGVSVRAAINGWPLPARWALWMLFLFLILLFTEGLGSEPGVFLYAQY